MEVRKYKILMITTCFVPFEFSEAIVNAKLVLALKNKGHQIDVISRVSDQFYNSEWSPLWADLKKDTYYMEEPKVGFFKRMLELLQAAVFFGTFIEGMRWGKKACHFAEELHSKQAYDVIISRMPANIPHLVGYKVSKKLGLPWIANWNDPTNNIRPLGEKVTWFSSWLTNRYVRKVFKQANINTFPSKPLWELYDNQILRTSDQSVRIIPHIGIELGAQDVSKPNKTPQICHAGNLLANIDVLPLIKAFWRLKHEDGFEFDFHVFGVIKAELPELIDQHELTDRIHIHPPKPYHQMIQKLRDFDFLMIIEAKYKEGILMLSKLSDYASLRKPILAISPKSGVTADYIQEYGGGIVLDNQSEEAIYTGLKRILGNFPDDSLSTSDHLLYEAFQPSKIAANYEDIISKLI